MAGLLLGSCAPNLIMERRTRPLYGGSIRSSIRWRRRIPRSSSLVGWVSDCVRRSLQSDLSAVARRAKAEAGRRKAEAYPTILFASGGFHLSARARWCAQGAPYLDLGRPLCAPPGFGPWDPYSRETFTAFQSFRPYIPDHERTTAPQAVQVWLPSLSVDRRYWVAR